MFARHKTPVSRLIAGVALCLIALVASVTLANAFAPTGETASLQTPDALYRQVEMQVMTRPLTNRITQENALPGTDDWANLGNYDINSLSAFPGEGLRRREHTLVLGPDGPVIRKSGIPVLRPL